MATKAKSPLSLNIQHDYITLKTPNGNFTTSWNGAKASGNLCKHPTAFPTLDKFVQGKIKDGMSCGDAMALLTDPKILSTLWAEWNAPVAVNDFKVGDEVMFKPGLYAKKFGTGTFVVTKVAKKNVFFKIGQESWGFDYQELLHK